LDISSKQTFSTTLDALLSNLSKTGRSRKQAVSVAIDSTLVMVSLWAAYSLRYGMPFSDFRSTWYLFVVLPIATVLVFMALGIYRWVVRSSNHKLFRQLLKGCIVAALCLILIMFLFPPNTSNPRSLFIIFCLLLVAGTCGVRFIWQSFFDANSRGEPVAIYGAGVAGQRLLYSLAQDSIFRPVIFIDDNTSLKGSTIGGLPLLIPDVNTIEHDLLGYEVERIILAMPSVSAEDYQSKIELFKHTGIPVQTIPSHSEIVAGNAKQGQIRDLSIGDILGRAEVSPDDNYLGKCVSGLVVLVTGGGGSIGSELCRQIVLQKPQKLIVLDHSEANLYEISEQLLGLLKEQKLPAELFLPQLCSVNDESKIKQIIATHNVNTIYHAAAYKHVPIIEAQPEQGVRVNIFGTLTVLDAAIENKIENFVLISTDKAVRPTNAMGASKRTAELVLQAKAHEQSITRISMVRFGNVLGSSGSVVPKFKKQIESNGPITITHPDITRYFMTIPEAAQLVLQASAIAKGGDVFVLDMGLPIKIEDLAVSMVALAGKKLQRDTGYAKDIAIEYEGLRPGEKMYEELFISGNQSSTVVKKVFTAAEAWLAWSDLQPKLQQLDKLDGVEHRLALKKLLIDTAFSGQISEKPSFPSPDRIESKANTSDYEVLVTS